MNFHKVSFIALNAVERRDIYGEIFACDHGEIQFTEDTEEEVERSWLGGRGEILYYRMVTLNNSFLSSIAFLYVVLL